jgi:hypothetical protein
LSRGTRLLCAEVFHVFMLATAAFGLVNGRHVAVQVQRTRACTPYISRLSRPQEGDGTAPVAALCDRETSRCPQTVLCTEVAEQCRFAREFQVRVRGRPRPVCSAIVRENGAGARGQSMRREQGYRA